MSRELKQYIESAFAKGASKSDLRKTLLDSGWSREVVDKILDQYVGVDANGLAIPAPRMQAHQLARDIFVYLLTFVTLSVSTCAIGGTLFHLLNVAFPDPASSYNYGHFGRDLSWSMAQIIVASPIFACLSYWTSLDLASHPEKRDSIVRKLMIYFILLITAIVGLGDLIFVLNHFLDGEMSIRFLGKAFTVLGLCGSVFYYYLREVLQDDKLVVSKAAVFE